ncbi:hypothetical protein Mpe_A2174 [Methylibium petroleiphilum PM1]|uniref:Uncharacterized protein n=2 Tax=Sphaerotilaceae TaxID=2975441 RepID=A2SHU1_METPP|nr:hypothetical protein Mpe_A2174 [Methylibium petroleiphilum PM1]
MRGVEAAGGRRMSSLSVTRYEIRFQSLFREGRALSFPCDAQGHVQLDALSEQARHNYLYARAVVGREYATPMVLALCAH